MNILMSFNPALFVEHKFFPFLQGQSKLFVEKGGRVYSIEDSRDLYVDWPDHDEINRLVVNEQEMMLREYCEEDE